MIDIVGQDTNDIKLYDTQTSKAANILSVQLGALEYNQELGIDLRYFLGENIRFQNDSFKAYLVERLAAFSINVNDVGDVMNKLYRQYTINVQPAETTTGLVAR